MLRKGKGRSKKGKREKKDERKHGGWGGCAYKGRGLDLEQYSSARNYFVLQGLFDNVWR